MLRSAIVVGIVILFSAVVAAIALAAGSSAAIAPNEKADPTPLGDLQHAVGVVDERLAQTETAIEAAEQDVQSLEREAAGAIAQFDRASAEFDAAAQAFAAARTAEQAASTRLDETAAAYRQAEQRYRWTSYAVIALATTAAVARACAGRMSTAQFRQAHGITDQSKHIDHIWPAARGGADHPVNYQVWPASRNMACGQNCLAQKLAEKPLSFVLALAVSVLVKLGCA